MSLLSFCVFYFLFFPFWWAWASGLNMGFRELDVLGASFSLVFFGSALLAGRLWIPIFFFDLFDMLRFV
ncbi:hypothetical protein AOQ84DRAFT_353513 [Glonium stellatum]|uniref:Uncharacterized protein n=1 Tax=Glonium stellatum TaxID=574774 RepID=A0A8E2F4L9_9PEZI|nr:hypothetical protein AOQ84DRAFT_353513 [Glonium stellatum]